MIIVMRRFWFSSHNSYFSWVYFPFTFTLSLSLSLSHSLSFFLSLFLSLSLSLTLSLSLSLSFSNSISLSLFFTCRRKGLKSVPSKRAVDVSTPRAVHASKARAWSCLELCGLSYVLFLVVTIGVEWWDADEEEKEEEEEGMELK